MPAVLVIIALKGRAGRANGSKQTAKRFELAQQVEDTSVLNLANSQTEAQSLRRQQTRNVVRLQLPATHLDS